MSGNQSISERIEAAVHGLLSFFARFSRTTWTIFRYPLTGIQRVAVADPGSRTYVLPLSYLAIGGFAFTLVLSAYPFGLLNLIDLIWFDDEISRTMYDRFSEAFTISGLLVAAFPVLFCVTVCGEFGKKLLCRSEEEETFVRLNQYAFGYQVVVFFIPFVGFMFLDVVFTAINGPYVKSRFNEDLSSLMSWIFIIIFGIIMVSGFLVPLASLSYWRFQFLKAHKDRRNAFGLAAMPVYVVVVFGLITYAASLPAILSERFEDASAEIKIDTVGGRDLTVRVSGGAFKGDARMNLVVYNNPNKPLVTEANNISLFLVVERDGEESLFWYAQQPQVRQNDHDLDILVIPAKEVQVLEISGAIDLSNEAVDLIRDKAAGKPIGNTYQLLLGLRLQHDGISLDRRVAIDTDAAIAGLP